jgi:hypothetical protein
MNHNRGSVTPNLPTIVSVEQINTCGSGPRAVSRAEHGAEQGGGSWWIRVWNSACGSALRCWLSSGPTSSCGTHVESSNDSGRTLAFRRAGSCRPPSQRWPARSSHRDSGCPSSPDHSTAQRQGSLSGIMRRIAITDLLVIIWAVLGAQLIRFEADCRSHPFGHEGAGVYDNFPRSGVHRIHAAAYRHLGAHAATARCL